MDKREVPRTPPPPAFRGIRHYHNQSSKKTDKQEPPRAPPPPPPPPFRGIRRYDQNQSSKKTDKQEPPRAPPPPPPPPFPRIGRYGKNQSSKKIDNEASPQFHPPPALCGTGRYHNQSSKKMDKEEPLRAPPPPPPPPFRGIRRYDHNQSSKKTDKQEPPRAPPPPPPPPFPGIRRYDHNQSSKKTDKEASPQASPPPPPPPFPGIGRYGQNQSSKKIDNEASPRAPPPPALRGTGHYHNQSKTMEKEEPPRAPPPPLFGGIGRYRNQSSKRMDKEEVPRAPPFLGFKRYHNQSSKNIDKEEVPRASPPPTPPLPPPFRGIRRNHNQSSKTMDKEAVARAPLPSLASQILEFMRYQKENPEERSICLLSHPTHPHNILQRLGGNTTKFVCFSCGEQKSLIRDQSDHFSCKTCAVEFHRGCHKFPRKVTHPYHLQHPLTFTFRNSETGMISDGNLDETFASTMFSESSCTSEVNTSDHEKSRSVQFTRFQSDVIVDKCTWCGNTIEGNWFYRCSICNFCLDLSCFQIIPPLLVANPKSHHHPLLFYPRPLLTPCDACGWVNVLEPSYACFQCNYMVHQSCINLPRVIKITRHQHRLFHTPYQPIISPCRVCYKIVDIKYGQYACNKEDCSYVAHSKCVTHENIWDGKELEWEPEEPSEAEDIAPFKKVGSDTIKHFSHEHVLKLEKFDGLRDAEKQCQACVLPINSRDFYTCMQCEFFLHEVCASLLRKLDHALHVHPLVLDPSPRDFLDENGCLVCCRKSSGFRYRCSKENCGVFFRAMIDVRCILVPDYFTHEAHEHPLFISTSYKSKAKIRCEGCKEICLMSYLQCSVCKFAMCYQCATIPNEICYKYDKHPLSLCYGEEADGMYWCEVCEKEVNPKDWFYTCNRCCTTIHLLCVFGSSAYMKQGFIFCYDLTSMEVIRNNSSTRPLCLRCGQRSPSSVYYKISWLKTKNSLCSLNCLEIRKSVS